MQLLAKNMAASRIIFWAQFFFYFALEPGLIQDGRHSVAKQDAVLFYVFFNTGFTKLDCRYLVGGTSE